MQTRDDGSRPAAHAPRSADRNAGGAYTTVDRVSERRADSPESRVDVVSLQRTAGNAAVARLLGGGRSPVLDLAGGGAGLMARLSQTASNAHHAQTGGESVAEPLAQFTPVGDGSQMSVEREEGPAQMLRRRPAGNTASPSLSRPVQRAFKDRDPGWVEDEIAGLSEELGEYRSRVLRHLNSDQASHSWEAELARVRGLGRIFEGESRATKRDAIFDDAVAVARAIEERFPPATHFYVGIGRSPALVTAYFAAQGYGATTLPLSSFRYGYGTAQALDEEDELRYRGHFERFLPDGEALAGRDVVIIDYAQQGGYSGMAARDYIERFYKDGTVGTKEQFFEARDGALAALWGWEYDHYPAFKVKLALFGGPDFSATAESAGLDPEDFEAKHLDRSEFVSSLDSETLKGLAEFAPGGRYSLDQYPEKTRNPRYEHVVDEHRSRLQANLATL